MGAVFQNSVEDGFGQVAVVEDLAPFPQWFVGGEDHWSFLVAPTINDAVENICCIVCVLKIANFIDDEDVVSKIDGCCFTQASFF